MVLRRNEDVDKLAHYNAWTEAWSTIQPSELPPQEFLDAITKEGPRWLRDVDGTSPAPTDHMRKIIACFKTAAKAHLILLGGNVPPTYELCDVLSESYDPRTECDCSGLFPVSDSLDTTALTSCICKSIQRVVLEGEAVNSREH